MKATLSAVVLVLAVAVAMGMSFDEYVQQYNKPYTKGSREYLLHKAVFLTNAEAIAKHNRDPTQTFKKDINMFTDMTTAQLHRFLGMNKGGRKTAFDGLQQFPAPKFNKSVADLPASVDWRDKGAVTPVKDQGGCGSCWAFASTETIESHAALSTSPPKQVILSTQQLVSCAPNPQHCGGTGGCGGSIAELAFDYVAKAGGMTTERLYPYTARDSPCSYNNQTTPPAVSLKGYVKLPENDYASLLNAIATIGPIAINVQANTWFSYSHGIFAANSCTLDNTVIDHVVQLVGYGTDAGKDYWIVRNSWGSSWGENGYIRLERTSGKKGGNGLVSVGGQLPG